jgi:pyridinium-3,5-biscarboxylic acid mononucleotide sulfurtransferase
MKEELWNARDRAIRKRAARIVKEIRSPGKDPGENESARASPRPSGEGVLAEKLEKLEALLASCRKVMVAFSGGVDSTFLLAVACRDPGRNVLAVTAVSPTHPEKEQQEARDMARRFPAEHRQIVTDEIRLEAFQKNPPDRCYHCKKYLFSRMDEIRVREGYEVLVDGTHADDTTDFRPGMRALRELGVRSPLLEAGLTKDEIRELSREMGLPTWDRPSLACLASRFPYGTEITEEALGRVDRCETFLRERVSGPVRVRVHGTVARIEVRPDAFPLLLRDRQEIAAYFRAQGFVYVTLDLAGFRSGSLNEVLKAP